MNYSKVFVKRILQDGNVVAQAKTVVVTSGNSQSTVSQTVTVEVSSEDSYSSSSTSSTTVSM